MNDGAKWAVAAVFVAFVVGCTLGNCYVRDMDVAPLCVRALTAGPTGSDSLVIYARFPVCLEIRPLKVK
jgi:hypothetical protein